MKIIAIVPALMLIGAAPPQPPATDAPEIEASESIARSETHVRIPGSDCRVVHVADDDEQAPPRARFMPLNEAPSGRAYYAVWRTDENGCPDPMYASGERFGR